MATMSARYTVIDGEVVAQERGGVRHQLVPDALGSTVALYDNAGTKTDTLSYWPYGESASRTGTTTAKFQYVGSFGYYQDSSTKQYVRARFLDAKVGRWITEDPIYPVSGVNSFSYAGVNPVSYIDSTGLIQQNPGDPKCKTKEEHFSESAKKCMKECSNKPSPLKCFEKCYGKAIGEGFKKNICYYLACKQYNGYDPCGNSDKGELCQPCQACIHFELSQCICMSKNLWDTKKCYEDYEKKKKKCLELGELK